MNYTYFVSWFYNQDGEWGFSNAVFTLDKKCNNKEIIIAITEDIEKEGYDKAVIISFQELSHKGEI